MIQLKNLTLRRGSKIILQDVQLQIQPGEKMAVIGQNGAGKSTLLAALLGELGPDQGDIVVPAQWRTAQVAQHLPDSTESATDFVLQGDSRLQQAQQALEQAQALGDGSAIAEAHGALQDADAFTARARAHTLLLGLGFEIAQLEASVNSFSGGWRMRLQLARALMCPSDLLVLDEPTNHLDMDAVVWLEGWLQRYVGTLLLISHDRDFLNAVSRVTLHLHQQKLTRYGGNYDFFEQQHALRLQQQHSAYERQQLQRSHLQHFIDRFKAKATKAKQAQSRIKALERMQLIAPVLAQAEFHFEFATPGQLPNPMLQLREVDCGYPASADHAEAKTILRHVDLTLLAGQRLGILGANGQGKSTLIKTLVGELTAQGGDITVGKDLRIGYFAQHELDQLHNDDTPLSHLSRVAKNMGSNAREQELRDFLGRFKFSGELAQQPIEQLSGGEKARLVLATLVWQEPNVLLLDEPTNHLDLDTREALSLALNGFAGSMLLVSHDRALLREVCDEFWWVHQGQARVFDGDLDDYQQQVQELAKAKNAALKQKEPGQETTRAAASGTRLSKKQEIALRQAMQQESKPHKKIIQDAEAAMARLDNEESQLHNHLAQTGQSPADLATWGKRLKDIGSEREDWEMQWLQAQETLESIEKQYAQDLQAN